MNKVDSFMLIFLWFLSFLLVIASTSYAYISNGISLVYMLNNVPDSIPPCIILHVDNLLVSIYIDFFLFVRYYLKSSTLLPLYS